MFDQVNQVIQEKIRPRLQEHQGDIQLISVEDGVVRIKF
ncbi:MAG TPA: NifU family protein, partial [Clostridiales bacterium]|nr:NifU family protein [Clostridiales bacterium]